MNAAANVVMNAAARPGRNAVSRADRIAAAWAVLDTVLDPEVPALSVRDLGIVRDVVLAGSNGEMPEPDCAMPGSDRALEIVLTLTYSGCPATEVIERSVLEAIDTAGLGPARVRLQRAPAWSSDWISAEGRRKLREYGIAPPGPVAGDEAVPLRFIRRPAAGRIACPRCASEDTEQLSSFGSTACKALYRCRACREPFEYFKPI